MKRAIVIVSMVVSVITVENAAWAEGKGRKLVPKPVPVSMKPGAVDGTRLGIGYNKITATNEWKDSWWTGDEETVGDLKYSVSNLVLGMVKTKANKSTVEWDLLIGVIDIKQDTEQFHYKSFPYASRGQTLNLKADGSGYDIGLRRVSSTNIFRQKNADGSSFIDQNYAISYHLALFTTDGNFDATSEDGRFQEGYKEEETGLFFRPVIALQPIISLSERFSVIPYIGIGTMLSMSSYYWENTAYKTFGGDQPGQFDDGSGIEVGLGGIETLFGFDFGFIIDPSHKHEITIGGAFNKIFGSSGSSFSEFHVLYSIPF